MDAGMGKIRLAGENVRVDEIGDVAANVRAVGDVDVPSGPNGMPGSARGKQPVRSRRIPRLPVRGEVWAAAATAGEGGDGCEGADPDVRGPVERRLL